MRRLFSYRFTVTEGRRIFIDSTGTQPSNSSLALVETLQLLVEHHKSGDVSMIHKTLDRLLSLDTTDAESRTIAFFKPCSTTVTCSENNGRTEAGIEGGSVPCRPQLPLSTPSSLHLVLQLMSSHANDVFVRERCCRCIANMCQLSSISSSFTATSCTTELQDNCHDEGASKGIADIMVEQGAVELTLGTLAMSHRLSAKGLAWTALATLNLVCLSRDGAQRAVRARGESVLSDAIVGMTHAPVSAKGLTSDQRIAMDGMLGALMRLLSLEADDNAAGVRFRHDQATCGTMEAVARALAWLSGSALRDIRCEDDVAGGSRRGGVLFFPMTSPSRQAAVLAFLPPLHKAWMALQSLSSCSKNMPLLYEVLYALSSPPTEGCGLQAAINAVLLLCVEVEGLAAVGAVEESELQQKMLLCAMETFVDLTSTRRDLSDRALAEAVEIATASKTSFGKDEAADGGVSVVIPTRAALAVWDTMAVGVVSSIAVSTIVRLHTAHQEEAACQGCDGSSVVLPSAYVYDNAVFDLLAKSLLTLANLAGHDVLVSSLNTLAVLHVMLQDAATILSTLREKFFLSPSERFDTARSQKWSVTLLQQCALVGQMYAVLWGVLRTPEGVNGVKELGIHHTTKQLQSVIEKMYIDAFPDVADTISNDSSNQVSPQLSLLTERRTTGENAAVEETVRRLILLGRRVVEFVNTTFFSGTPSNNKEASAAL